MADFQCVMSFVIFCC